MLSYVTSPIRRLVDYSLSFVFTPGRQEASSAASRLSPASNQSSPPTSSRCSSTSNQSSSQPMLQLEPGTPPLPDFYEALHNTLKERGDWTGKIIMDRTASIQPVPSASEGNQNVSTESTLDETAVAAVAAEAAAAEYLKRVASAPPAYGGMRIHHHQFTSPPVRI